MEQQLPYYSCCGSMWLIYDVICRCINWRRYIKWSPITFCNLPGVLETLGLWKHCQSRSFGSKLCKYQQSQYSLNSTLLEGLVGFLQEHDPSFSLPVAPGARRVCTRVFTGKCLLMSKLCAGWKLGSGPGGHMQLTEVDICFHLCAVHALAFCFKYNCSSSLGKNAIFVFVQQVCYH